MTTLAQPTAVKLKMINGKTESVEIETITDTTVTTAQETTGYNIIVSSVGQIMLQATGESAKYQFFPVFEAWAQVPNDNVQADIAAEVVGDITKLASKEARIEFAKMLTEQTEMTVSTKHPVIKLAKQYNKVQKNVANLEADVAREQHNVDTLKADPAIAASLAAGEAIDQDLAVAQAALASVQSKLQEFQVQLMVLGQKLLGQTFSLVVEEASDEEE